MSLDALSTILPTPSASQDTATKIAIPAASSSASSDKGTVPRRVEAFDSSPTNNKVGISSSKDHVDERI
ncbi:MAG: hypothetical protein HQM15_04660 [Deltaproteobacteria bacterium]|nr:hypothetical protein [Deltaproteobacteria bacterium]